LRIAETAAAILRERGETAKVEPKLVGTLVRNLGFTPKRDSQAYALCVSEMVRRQIHYVARDYDLQVLPKAGMDCSYCAEIAGAGSGTT
jgi:hypothetical protein